MLAGARSPFVIAGGSRWDAAACAALRTLAERWHLPVGCAFRNQDLFDNRHPQYAGDVGIGINPTLAERVRGADVLLVIGERLGEMTTSGYTLLSVPAPRQALLHVHPGAEELGRVYQPAHAICATPGAFLDAFNTLAVPAAPPWHDSAAAAHAQYEAWRAPRPVPGAVDLWQIVDWLDARLPDDAMIANGAGNYATWMHRLFRYRRFRTQLAPYVGAMGYGVPAALAAKFAHPERIVLSWNGDGCFQMNGQELATAVQNRLAIVFVVIDNGMFGTIRSTPWDHREPPAQREPPERQVPPGSWLLPSTMRWSPTPHLRSPDPRHGPCQVRSVNFLEKSSAYRSISQTRRRSESMRKLEVTTGLLPRSSTASIPSTAARRGKS